MITMPLTTDRYLESITADCTEIGDLCRLHPQRTVPTCPEWTGADLLAHLTAFAIWLRELYAGSGDLSTPLSIVSPEDSTRDWDENSGHLLTILRETDPQTGVPNWSTGAQTAAFWLRRCAQDVAIHRWDAARLVSDGPRAVPADIALDGIDEYLNVFVSTAFATGAAPEAEDTVCLEITDLDDSVRRDLPHPGPVTTLRGTASDLLLGLWHRHDPLKLFVSGNRQLIAHWPHI